MDIFDGARVVARWWFVALPIVVITAAASVLFTSGIQPEYTAEGSVLMLGPAVRESEDEPGEFDTLNPLIDQPSALETVAVVVALSIDGPEVRNILAAEGLSTAFALGTERGVPIILLETRADARNIALRTAERLAELIDEEVRLRQVAGDVPQSERVTTSVVQLGAVGGADFGGRTRVRILVGALGVGTAFGAAFLLEGLKRRRSEAAEPSESTVVSVSSADEVGAQSEFPIDSDGPELSEPATAEQGGAEVPGHDETVADEKVSERERGENGVDRLERQNLTDDARTSG